MFWRVIVEGGRVGFSGGFRFDGETWTSCEYGSEPDDGDPWSMMVHVHDSDIAVILYRPAGPGSGQTYVGSPPSAFDPHHTPILTRVDSEREARGLAAWWAQRVGAGDHARRAKEAELVEYLAEDEKHRTRDLDTGDIAEIFAEVKTARFLTTLDLSVPDGLPRPDL